MIAVRTLTIMLILGLLAGCGSDPSSGEPDAPVPPTTGDRVLLIGVDAATWDLLGPFMEAGDLPTFRRLVEEGWSATLMSMEPTVSPALWTTIATGKSPAKHGITGFLGAAEDGSDVPITSNLRRTEALWTIASRAERAVNVIGWYVTWPVEPIRGVMVSDRFGPKVKEGLVGGAASLTAEHPGVHPAELAAELEELIVHPEDFLLPEERRHHENFNIYPVDATRVAVADRVFREHPADLNLVYLWGIDPTQHYFWKHWQPDRWPGPKVSEAEILVNRDRIPEYYRDTDAFLAALLEHADDRTTVIIVSDHGAGPVERYDPDKPVSGDHRIEGVIIAAGQHVRPGRGGSAPSIKDVTPTVLYLLGLPVGRDMEGRVITDMIDPALLAARQPATIATWETGERPAEGAAVRSQGDDSIKDRLRSLGYIE